MSQVRCPWCGDPVFEFSGPGRLLLPSHSAALRRGRRCRGAEKEVEIEAAGEIPGRYSCRPFGLSGEEGDGWSTTYVQGEGDAPVWNDAEPVAEPAEVAADVPVDPIGRYSGTGTIVAGLELLAQDLRPINLDASALLSIAARLIDSRGVALAAIRAALDEIG